jgi:hypothetical protein
MPRTRITCPNCRQPVLADIDQLFDVGQDPDAKQRILSGGFNYFECPNCHYAGTAKTPIVYHDPQKELLLTYFPPELNVPRDEQERVIGNMITQVVNKLPQEQRKGYLLRPQSTLTLQGLIERVLEGEGITKEMIQAQQQRLNLIQRLVSADDDVIDEIAKQEDQLIDGEFFTLLSRLTEISLAGGDQEGSRRLNDLQRKLTTVTTFGKQLEEQTKEVEAAVKSLQDAGKDLNREKLLDIVLAAPTDTRVNALVSLARPGMDYEFFQMLSQRIERARGAGRERLIKLREQLLELTRQFDQQMEARATQSRQLLQTILQAPNVTEAVQQNLPAVDDFFIQQLNSELEAARKSGDLTRLGKLQEVVEVIQTANTPPEVMLVEEMLDLPDDATRQAWLESHKEEITPQFIDTLTSLVAQTQKSEDKDLQARLQAVYRAALRFSMQANMKQ